MPEAIEVGLGLTGPGGPGGPDPGGGWVPTAEGLFSMCLTCFTESSLLERVLDLEPARVSAPLLELEAKLAMPDSEPVGGLIERWPTESGDRIM